MRFTKYIQPTISACTWKSKDNALHQGSDLGVNVNTCKSKENAILQGHKHIIVLTPGNQRIVHFIKDMHLTILMLPTRNQSTMHFTKDRISIITTCFWKSKDNVIQHNVHGNAQYGILAFEGTKK
jgi:hypothetical protein